MFSDDEDGLTKDPPPPHAYRTLYRHKSTLSFFYRAVEAATERARDLLRKPGLHYDGSFYCHLVRYLITNKAISQETQKRYGFRFFPLPNTGLEVLSDGDRIRIWKATGEGEIPPPGDSAGRQAFCDQPIDPTLFAPEDYAIVNPGRLVLLWDTDTSLGLNRFDLACPWEWKTIWDSPKAHWQLAVPHPATWITPVEDFKSKEEDFELDLDALGDEQPEDR